MSYKCKLILTNLVTLLRLFGIFLLIPIYRVYGGNVTFIFTAVLFLTDSLDGFLARHLNTSTFFGSFLDGFSDKVFLIVNLILIMDKLPIGNICILIEVLILIVQFIKYLKGYNVKSNIYGKVKMWVAGITISISFLTLNKLSKDILVIIYIPFIISGVITLISYILEFNTLKVDKKANVNISLKEFLFSNQVYEKYQDYDIIDILKQVR